MDVVAVKTWKMKLLECVLVNWHYLYMPGQDCKREHSREVLIYTNPLFSMKRNILNGVVFLSTKYEADCTCLAVFTHSGCSVSLY